jgi:hypothetical protein
MLRISCNGCGTSAYADCACPGLGHNPGAAGVHHAACPFTDLGANVTCPPGSGCCDGSPHPGVSHDAAANACPQIDAGTHGSCPEPDGCKSWYGMNDHRYEHLVNGTSPPPCPGGHCHQGLPDCTVCRTVTIEVLPGTVPVSTGA